MCRRVASPLRISYRSPATPSVALAGKLRSVIATPKNPMHAVLLTFVLSLPQGVTSLTQEYQDRAACEAASAQIRERLAAGRVVLLLCTSQS